MTFVRAICPGDICPYQEYLSCYWQPLWPNFKDRFLGISRTDSNCHSGIYPDNICPDDIYPYQEYLSCYRINFDQTLKVDSQKNVLTLIILPKSFCTLNLLDLTFLDLNFLTSFWSTLFGTYLFLTGNYFGSNTFKPKVFRTWIIFGSNIFWTWFFRQKYQQPQPQF